MIKIIKPSHIILFAFLMAVSCSGPDKRMILNSEQPVHLEEHLDKAKIVGSEAPEDIPEIINWRFDVPQPDWKPAVPKTPSWKPVQIEQTKDSLRITLNEDNRMPGSILVGAVYIKTPDMRITDWSDIIIQVRSEDRFEELGLAFNPPEAQSAQGITNPALNPGESVPVVSDGFEHTYKVQVSFSSMLFEHPWNVIGIYFTTNEPGSLEILSVSLIPKAARYANESAGVLEEQIDNFIRRTLYSHTPGRIEYKVRIPEGGRLDLGLGVLHDETPVTFKVTVEDAKKNKTTLFEKAHAESGSWMQQSVDLSDFEGKTVKLALEAESDRAGTVALWAAPTITGARRTEKPNVIFYVIDAAGADYMSLYGYDHKTTPYLEELALEGAVFEKAYSNSTWTKPSNFSFMTSLHHSVLGGFKTAMDPLPDEAVTMAQHFHRANYLTAVFTSNTNAGTLSGFQREVDIFTDTHVSSSSTSSVKLHQDFWDWRRAYPKGLYWVHFQTTDVHPPYNPVDPFAGLFVSPEEKKQLRGWQRQMNQEFVYNATSISDEQNIKMKKLGLEPVPYFNSSRGLYEETMAHQDYQISQLVKRLKAEGEWENTLLIIASDHGHPAATFSRFGRALEDPPPEEWEGAILGSFKTWIPLMFIWPGHIAGGQRFSQHVSMIDMLPTVLDLTDLPLPEGLQGQSLAPLLLGKKGWEQKPVIFDEIYVDTKTGDLLGNIEVIDGQWGASLEIALGPDGKELFAYRRYQAPASGRWRYPPHDFPNIPRVLVYDLGNDPHALSNINEERPDLVDKYTKFLENKWKEHQALAKNFSQSQKGSLTKEQIENLRSLGYIR